MTDKTLPLDALDPKFLERVRRLYQQGDQTSKAFQIASDDLAEKDRRHYLNVALQSGGAKLYDVLLSIIDEAGDMPLAERARAAVLFVHGHSAGFWTATAREADLARALILSHFGELPMLEKTKNDLAREAGLPTRDFVSVKPKLQPTPAPDSKTLRKVQKDTLALLVFVATEAEHLAHALDHGTPAQRLEAIECWFAAFGPVWPQDVIAEVNARLSPH